ncbi:MAG: hypothetical protein NC320_10235 [Clostridium sp.]|nr:hypothetical protein [Clostridium sp.]MCM1547791.1 hypothetical protein [Ruminococcus sp.]
MNTDLIKEIQVRINNLMKKYEDNTRKLLECPIDDVLILTENRQSISKEISKLDSQIKQECAENEKALNAYTNKCGRNELSEELQAVFDLRQEFNAIAFRVSEMDPEITERISIMRDELICKIKKNNSGQNAKAAKYAQVGMPTGDNLFFPENKKRI